MTVTNNDKIVICDFFCSTGLEISTQNNRLTKMQLLIFFSSYLCLADFIDSYRTKLSSIISNSVILYCINMVALVQLFLLCHFIWRNFWKHEVFRDYKKSN